MLSSTDLIPLSYTPDLTEAGVLCACRSLACTPCNVGGASFDRLRRSVAAVAVELALRRHLGRLAIAFEVLEAAPLGDPDHYDLVLGGHRCEVRSFLVSRREPVAQIRRDPALLLQAPALIPLEESGVERRSSRDLYVFAFLLALTASSREDLRRAQAAGQPFYLIHPRRKPGPSPPSGRRWKGWR